MVRKRSTASSSWPNAKEAFLALLFLVLRGANRVAPLDLSYLTNQEERPAVQKSFAFRWVEPRHNSLIAYPGHRPSSEAHRELGCGANKGA